MLEGAGTKSSMSSSSSSGVSWCEPTGASRISCIIVFDVIHWLEYARDVIEARELDVWISQQEGNEAPAARLKERSQGANKQTPRVKFDEPSGGDVDEGGCNDAELPGAGAHPLGGMTDLTKITRLPQQPAAQAVRVGGAGVQAAKVEENLREGAAESESEPAVSVVGEIFEREPAAAPVAPTAPSIPTGRGFPSAKHRTALNLGKSREKAAVAGQQASEQGVRGPQVR